MIYLTQKHGAHQTKNPPTEPSWGARGPSGSELSQGLVPAAQQSQICEGANGLQLCQGSSGDPLGSLGLVKDDEKILCRNLENDL